MLIYSISLAWDYPKRWINILCDPIKIPAVAFPFIIIGSSYFLYDEVTSMVVAGVLGLLWAVWGVEIKLPEAVYIITERIVPNRVKNSFLYVNYSETQSRDMDRRRKVLFT